MFNYGNTQNSIHLCPESLVLTSSPKQKDTPISVTGIIDTGAVMTCIPEHIIIKLKPDNLAYSFKKVQGPFGSIQERKSYFINMKIAECVFLNIEVLTIEKHYAIIGRDIINSYKLILDPFNKKWSVKK